MLKSVLIFNLVLFLGDSPVSQLKLKKPPLVEDKLGSSERKGDKLDVKCENY